jgi:uncharacterized membrane protein YhaH (DUF805 family)
MDHMNTLANTSYTPWGYYLKVLKQYVDFEGRARRSEFWFFQLFNFLINLGLIFLIFLTGNKHSPLNGLSFIYSLAVFLPSLAVSVRRLHDIDRSGWWLLIAFIPFVGAIVLLIFDFTEGTSGPNNFGADPKRIN